MDELPFFDGGTTPAAPMVESTWASPEFIFALQSVNGLSNYQVRMLLTKFHSIEALQSASPLELEQVAKCSKFSFSNIEPIEVPADVDSKFVTFFDEIYPRGLRDLRDAPLILWYRGTIPQGPSISIVGTREAVPWAKKVTRDLAKISVESGRSVVSGLAFGIDHEAHRGCLEAGGTTVAILACDVKFPTPRAHTSLAEEIIESGGCLIAEVPPGTQTQSSQLIARNRLQAAWSSSLLVTQSGIPSGTLHTVRFALELRRKLLVVQPPKDIDQQAFLGNANLTSLFNFDPRILGGTKAFQSKVASRSPCADVVVSNLQKFQEFLDSENDQSHRI